MVVKETQCPCCWPWSQIDGEEKAELTDQHERLTRRLLSLKKDCGCQGTPCEHDFEKFAPKEE